MLKSSTEKFLSNLLLIGMSLITLVVYTQGVTDPVNVPKLFLLGGFALSLLAIFSISDVKKIFKKNPLPVLFLLLFLIASLISLLSSSAPFSQSFYGVYGRNNGFLLYFFLTILFFSAMSVSQRHTFQGLSRALYLSGIVNIIYCMWVVFFGDFVGWSNQYGNILGTLGNPNFIGSFFGMFSAILFSKIFSRNNSYRNRIIDLVILVLTIFLIYKSQAVQGRILLVAAFTISVLFYYFSKKNGRFPLTLIVGISTLMALLGILGTLQKGPLANMLYKDSVSLRGQYWYAGFQMGKQHLINGVGFDSYGDWYRETRRLGALTRPGIEVTSNTAHNVFLDIFAFGGIPLLFSYIGLILLTFSSIFTYLKSNRIYDPVYVGLVGAWICYLLQSLISINQIGLAIWGWALAGAIIAYSRNPQNPNVDASKVPKQKKRIQTNEITLLSPSLRSWIGFLVGLLIAVPPLSSDMRWRSAQVSRDALKVQQSLQPSYMNPVNSFQYVSTIGVLIDSGLQDLALKYAREAVKFNPRSYESWRIFTFLDNAKSSEKLKALTMMRKLDPLNPKNYN